MELDEQHKRSERDPPAQQHAGDPKGPAEAGHGEREGEDSGADHRREVVLRVFFCISGFLSFEKIERERAAR